MNAQLDLFAGLIAARSTDPITSHEAALSVTVRAGSQQAQLLQAYADAGALGLTDDEAGVNTGLAAKPGCCWWKRCSELRQAGYIVPIGNVTRLSRAGENQQVCGITNAGIEALQ